jgi:deoxyadenosine/deoxycytidine kinase
MMVVIEGTVGCGKTTLASFLSEKLNIKLYEELLSADTNILLEKFYKDQTRWSFALQVHFLNERFRMIKEINKINSGLLDRSIYGDNIFAQLLNEGGNMTDEEYRTYSTLLNNMLEHVSPPDLMVYLKCKTKTAVDRINKRNRGEESHVDLAYWQGLNNKYNQWYSEYDSSKKMVIEVDDFNVFDVNQRENVLNQIIERLKKE